MKYPVIAIVVALSSSVVWAQSVPNGGQSSAASVVNGQAQATTSTGQSKPQANNNANSSTAQQNDEHGVSSWSLLGEGWKQFDPPPPVQPGK